MATPVLSKNILYYGKDDPLPERIELRAGPLRMFYEDGDLRSVRLGDQEILRRIYVAIRDRNWGTILPRFSNVKMDLREDSFRISYAVENRQGEIDFAWTGTITGEPDGTVTFQMDGAARSTFWKNRIGFCVLHPAGAAGAPCRVRHADGSTETAPLPILISPDQPVKPFYDLGVLSHQVEPGVWSEVTFSGDLFEMEDQRNWTDASYKTFCTPLRIPYPAEIQAGTEVHQTITLQIRREKPAGEQPPAGAQEQAAALSFRVDWDGPSHPLPQIGLGSASHGEPLSGGEIKRLQALGLSHLRVDLRLADPDWAGRLERAAQEAAALGVKLEVALLVAAEAELEALTEAVARIRPPVARWLVYPAKEAFGGGSPTARVLEWTRHRLDQLIPGAEWAAGTNTDLIFMLRTPPPLDRIDLLTFAIIPEAHAFDNASIVETLEAQGQAAGTARHLAGDRPVIVSPVTFKMRHNPYATGDWPVVVPGDLPPMVDVRQMSLFGAGWTAGSLSYLALAGVSSVTYFETTGWRGVMETESGSPLPDKFHSLPGGVFPMYHVFADVAEYGAGAEVIPVHSSDALAVDGLALRKDERARLLLANFTAEPQIVALSGLAAEVRVRTLDETNVGEAMQSPEAFRARPGEARQTMGGRLALQLRPFAVTRLDYSI